MGVGYAHGWDPVGSQFRVTRSRGFWLRTLDGRPASETYAELFGYPARDWAFPPLNYLARLYPLGVEQGDELVVRAPIRVEADGSFRMNANVRDGIDAYLLVGSNTACEKAAGQAAQQALHALGSARPFFALVLVDVAWQMLLKAKAGSEVVRRSRYSWFISADCGRLYTWTNCSWQRRCISAFSKSAHCRDRVWGSFLLTF